MNRVADAESRESGSESDDVTYAELTRLISRAISVCFVGISLVCCVYWVYEEAMRIKQEEETRKSFHDVCATLSPGAACNQMWVVLGQIAERECVKRWWEILVYAVLWVFVTAVLVWIGLGLVLARVCIILSFGHLLVEELDKIESSESQDSLGLSDESSSFGSVQI